MTLTRSNMLIETEVARLEQRQSASEDNIREIFEDIKEIKDDLLRRPSWAISALITILSSATVGLLVAFVSKN